MRCLTYNVRLGKQQGLRPIIARIQALDADLVALQEIGQGWVEGAGGDMTARIARACDYEYARFIPCITHDDDPAARYGHAVLSRHPIGVVQLHPLPRNRDEPRVLFEGIVHTPLGDITWLSTHLSWLATDRPDQGEVLRRRAEAHHRDGQHVLITGDLNEHHDTRDDWLDHLQKLFHDADATLNRKTWPAHQPTERIDYLLSNRGLWQHTTVPADADASDHRPVCATLILPTT